MTNQIGLISRLKAIRAEAGYGEFDRAIRAINKERLGTQVETRKPMPRNLKVKLYAKQSGLCARCMFHFSIDRMTDDHTVPIARGGTNKSWNRRLVCGPCNSSKGDNTPLQESKKTGQTITEQMGIAANGIQQPS